MSIGLDSGKGVTVSVKTDITSNHGDAAMSFICQKEHTAETLADVIWLSIHEGAMTKRGLFEAIRKHMDRLGRTIPASETHFIEQSRNVESSFYDRFEPLIPILKECGQPWILQYLAEAAGYKIVICNNQ